MFAEESKVSEILSLLEMYVMPVIRPALELADTVPGWGACLLMLLFFGLSILFGMIHGAFASKEKARSIEIRGFMICLCGALTGWTVYRGLSGDAVSPDTLMLSIALALAAITLLVMLVRRHFAALIQFIFALLSAVMLGKLCSGIEPMGAAVALYAALALIGSWLEWAVGKATKDINSGDRKKLEKKLDPQSTEEAEVQAYDLTEDAVSEAIGETSPEEDAPQDSGEDSSEETPQEPVRTIDYEEIFGDIITRGASQEASAQEAEEETEEAQEELTVREETAETEQEAVMPETSGNEQETEETEPDAEPDQIKFEDLAAEEAEEGSSAEMTEEETPVEQPEELPSPEEEVITEETQETQPEEMPAAEPEAESADPEEKVRREAMSLLEDLALEAERELAEGTDEIPEPSGMQEIQITAEVPELPEEEQTSDDGFRIVLSDAEITGEIEIGSAEEERSATAMPEDNDGKNTINIAVFGPKGSGKTTLTWALSMINSEFGGREYTPEELDSTALEKEKGTTVEPSFIEYESRLRHIVHIDCPGDPEYYKNEIRGLTEADIGILVIAINGHVTDAREHLYNARMAGIRNLVVFINKCDMENVTEDDIDSVDSRINRLISKEFDFSDVVTVSGSALAAAKDDEDQLFWINSIRELQFTLDTMNTARRDQNGELRMPIGKVYTTPGLGTVVTGRIRSGSVSTGKRVTINGYSDDKRHATVAAIHAFGKEKDMARAGECVGIQLREITAQRIRRGQVITDSNNGKGHRRIGAEFSYVKYTRKDANGRPMSLWDSTKLQFWFGTTDVTGEIRLQEEELHLPGDDFVVIIDLEKPVPINVGDRFLAKQGALTVAYGEVVRTD